MMIVKETSKINCFQKCPSHSRMQRKPSKLAKKMEKVEDCGVRSPGGKVPIACQEVNYLQSIA